MRKTWAGKLLAMVLTGVTVCHGDHAGICSVC